MSSSKRVQWRRGMGAFGVFGAVFFTVAWAICQKPGTPAVLGWILGGLAICFLLFRAGVIVDGDRKRVTSWWGLRLPFLLNIPFLWKRRGVPNAAQVVLRRVTKGSDKSTWTAYSVFLEGDRGQEICYFASFLKARTEGERLADALGLSLHDQTSHEAHSHREAGTLDRPLGERLRAAGRTFPILQPRAHAGVERVRDGRTFVFEAPKHRRKALLQVRAPLMVMAVIASLLLFELSLEPVPSKALLVGVGVVVGGMGLVAMGLIHGATERVRLFASPAGLRLERRTAFSFRTVDIPAGELEELDVGISRGGSGWTVLSGRSDRALLEFGARLEKRDLEWLHEAVLGALYGPDGSEPPPTRG